MKRLGAAVLVSLAAPSLAASPAPRGNPDQGEAIYERCQACHALAYNRTGPMHCGLFGRRAGTVPGFTYSAAMVTSNIIWNEKTLDRFIAAPTKMIPGTAMGYAGISDPLERADLIAWLKRTTASPEACARR
jgi:cytochrome c